MCHCSNTGLNRHRITAQKVNSRGKKTKKLPPFLPGPELAIFRSRVRHSTSTHRASSRVSLSTLNTGTDAGQRNRCRQTDRADTLFLHPETGKKRQLLQQRPSERITAHAQRPLLPYRSLISSIKKKKRRRKKR